MKSSLPQTNKVEKIRNAYDSTAEFYDARYKYLQYLKYSFLLPALIDRKVLPEVRIKGPILDSGGGTGLFLDFLYEFSDFLRNQEFSDGEIKLMMDFTQFGIQRKDTIQLKSMSSVSNAMIICDVSFEMLRLASRNHHLAYGTVACDISHLPFRDGIFPTAVAFTVFQNIEDVEDAITEVYRVLIDGGILGTSLLKKVSDKLQFAGVLGKYFQNISPIFVNTILEDFQKLNVQSDKYSPFHDLEKVEDYFLTAKKNPRNTK